MWKYYKLQHLKSLKFKTKYNAVVTTIFTCIVILQGFSYPAIEFQKKVSQKGNCLEYFLYTVPIQNMNHSSNNMASPQALPSGQTSRYAKQYLRTAKFLLKFLSIGHYFFLHVYRLLEPPAWLPLIYVCVIEEALFFVCHTNSKIMMLNYLKQYRYNTVY